MASFPIGEFTEFTIGEFIVREFTIGELPRPDSIRILGVLLSLDTLTALFN